jgi:hypothetical protein
VLKEVIIPAIEKEVNEGKSFAPLRQVYSGMLLATWYKKALKESILGKVYADQGKVRGIDQDPGINQEIYAQYVQAFRQGVFNMIREDVDRYTNEVIPRKYFSGGLKNDFAQVMTSGAAELAEEVAAVRAGGTDVVVTRVDDPGASMVADLRTTGYMLAVRQAAEQVLAGLNQQTEQRELSFKVRAGAPVSEAILYRHARMTLTHKLVRRINFSSADGLGETVYQQIRGALTMVDLSPQAADGRKSYRLGYAPVSSPDEQDAGVIAQRLAQTFLEDYRRNHRTPPGEVVVISDESVLVHAQDLLSARLKSWIMTSAGKIARQYVEQAWKGELQISKVQRDGETVNYDVSFRSNDPAQDVVVSDRESTSAGVAASVAAAQRLARRLTRDGFNVGRLLRAHWGGIGTGDLSVDAIRGELAGSVNQMFQASYGVVLFDANEMQGIVTFGAGEYKILGQTVALADADGKNMVLAGAMDLKQNFIPALLRHLRARYGLDGSVAVREAEGIKRTAQGARAAADMLWNGSSDALRGELEDAFRSANGDKELRTTGDYTHYVARLINLSFHLYGIQVFDLSAGADTRSYGSISGDQYNWFGVPVAKGDWRAGSLRVDPDQVQAFARGLALELQKRFGLDDSFKRQDSVGDPAMAAPRSLALASSRPDNAAVTEALAKTDSAMLDDWLLGGGFLLVVGVVGYLWLADKLDQKRLERKRNQDQAMSAPRSLALASSRPDNFSVSESLAKSDSAMTGWEILGLVAAGYLMWSMRASTLSKVTEIEVKRARDAYEEALRRSLQDASSSTRLLDRAREEYAEAMRRQLTGDGLYFYNKERTVARAFERMGASAWGVFAGMEDLRQKEHRAVWADLKRLFDIDMSRPDAAMASPQSLASTPTGGIDLNSSSLNMQIKRDGNGVPLPVSEQDLENIYINGLVPVILDIQPGIMAVPLLKK